MNEQNQLPPGSMIAGLTPQQMQLLQAQAAQSQFPNQMMANSGSHHQIVASGGNVMSQFPPQYQQQIQLQRQYQAQAQAQARAQLQQQQMQQFQRQQQIALQQQQQFQNQQRQQQHLLQQQQQHLQQQHQQPHQQQKSKQQQRQPQQPQQQQQQLRRNSQVHSSQNIHQIHQQPQQQQQSQQTQAIPQSKGVRTSSQPIPQSVHNHPTPSPRSHPQSLPVKNSPSGTLPIQNQLLPNQADPVSFQPPSKPLPPSQPQQQQLQQQQQTNSIPSKINRLGTGVKSSTPQNSQQHLVDQQPHPSQQQQPQLQKHQTKVSGQQMAQNQQNAQFVNAMNSQVNQSTEEVAQINKAMAVPGVTAQNNLNVHQQAFSGNSMAPAISFNNMPAVIKQAMAITRLNQFCEALSKVTEEKNTIDYWQDVLKDFFTENAVLKYIVGNGAEAIPYDLPFAIIPRLYYTLSNSGVQKIQLNFEVARPTSMPNGLFIECPKISIAYWFGSDTIVTATGHLRVIMNPKLKFEFMEQSSKDFKEFISRSQCISSLSGKTSAPKSRVGEYGFTEEVIRFLQLSETTVQMRELFLQASLPNAQNPLSLFEQFPSNFYQQQRRQWFQKQAYLQKQQLLQQQQRDVIKQAGFKDESSNKAVEVKDENISYIPQQMTNESLTNLVNTGQASPKLVFSNLKNSVSTNNSPMMANSSLSEAASFSNGVKAESSISPKPGQKRKRQTTKEGTRSPKVRPSPKISKR